jgi:polysaccharide export outer membrane protein
MKSNIRGGRGTLSNGIFCSGFSYFLFVLILSSCTTNKNITYFKDIPDSLYRVTHNITQVPFADPLIQPGDLLQISILTLDPEANNVLTSNNSGNYSVQPGSSNGGNTPSTITGFLIDKDGYIEIPIAGKIKLSGLTTSEARDSIHRAISNYYKDPVVNVRFANFSVTVLGEVARPATYVVPNEKISILDAIGMAGDLTIFGKRENVLLVRDSAGRKQFTRFNLNSSETFTSPYFYLRQGDMVYVEPNKSKVVSTDAVRTRNITLLASGLTVLIAIITRF